MKDLDAQVAEKVMGWTVQDDYLRDSHGYYMRSLEGCSADWSPSTSISDAWLVVEEMRKRGFQVVVRTPAVFSLSRCEISESSSMWTGEADTAPEAICRAALEAVDG